ncbi:MAG: Gldg family protein [Nannocystaceae bacterium]
MIDAARRWWVGTAAILHRELLSLFVTPLAYVVGTMFLLNQGWNFSLLLQFLNDPTAAPGPVMQFYFGGSFFILWFPVIFICSAMSMRLLVEERRQGTLEALLTAPLRPSQLVVGKFIGTYAFYICLWIPTGVFYLLLASASSATTGGMPEPGPIMAGYLGVLLVGGSFLAIGLVASAIVRSQLAAALSTFVVCTIVLMAGLLVEQVESEGVAMALEWTSLMAMMREMAQGIVDGHWIGLHVAVVVTALAAAVVAIDPRRRWQNLLQVVLLGVVMTNLAVFAGRHTGRSDWTRGSVYTLSDRAKEVLRSIVAPIDVTVIVPTHLGGGRPNPVLGELREVLSRMGVIVPSMRIRLIDPDRDRQETEQLLVDFGLGGRELADGIILVRSKQGPDLRRAHVLPRDLVTFATGPDVAAHGPRVRAFRGEEALLQAFLDVADPRQIRLCYTQGHGEKAFDNLEPYGGYAHLRELLEGAGITTAVADLDGRDGLAGCDVLLIAGPEGALPLPHVDAIASYAKRGGDLLLLTGAVFLSGHQSLAPNGLEPLAASYGIRFGDRVVLDPHRMPGASALLAFTLSEGWSDHGVSRSLITRPVSFVQVRELRVEDPATALLEISEQGWAESNIAGFRAGSVQQYNEGVDAGGPLPVAAAAERGSSRMVVLASDRMALNAFLRADVAYDHGRDLILNAVGWLSQRDTLMGIRPREREHIKLLLQPTQLRRMTLLCILGLPAFAIGLGLIVLWRRRR